MCYIVIRFYLFALNDLFCFGFWFVYKWVLVWIFLDISLFVCSSGVYIAKVFNCLSKRKWHCWSCCVLPFPSQLWSRVFGLINMIQLLFSFSGSMYVCVYDVCGASAWMLSVLSVSSHPRSIPFTTRTGIILANKQEWNSIATEFILCDQCTQLKVFHCIRVTSKRARTMFFLCTSVLYLKVRSDVYIRTGSKYLL